MTLESAVTVRILDDRVTLTSPEGLCTQAAANTEESV